MAKLSPLRPTVSVLLGSAALCVAITLVLPLFGVMSARHHEALELRDAPDVVLPPPPTDRAPVSKPKRAQAKREQPRAPRLEPRSERITGRVSALPTVSLPATALELDAGAAVLDLSFDVRKPVSSPPPPDVPAAPEVESPQVPDTQPVPRLRTRPAYPAHARRRGITGYVDLDILVGEDGRVTGVEVLGSVPGSTFVRAAEQAVRQWRFTPATRKGRPVAGRFHQRIRFKIEDEGRTR